MIIYPRKGPGTLSGILLFVPMIFVLVLFGFFFNNWEAGIAVAILTFLVTALIYGVS